MDKEELNKTVEDYFKKYDSGGRDKYWYLNAILHGIKLILLVLINK